VTTHRTTQTSNSGEAEHRFVVKRPSRGKSRPRS
jgi:hypothetical protein